MINHISSLLLILTTAIVGRLASVVDINFSSKENFILLMDNVTHIDYSITINNNNITALTTAQSILIQFKPLTLSPQFDIIEFAASNSTEPENVVITIDQLKTNNYIYNSSISLKATYIGHATLESKAYLLKKETNESLSISTNPRPLEITVNRLKGPLEKVFMYSVIIFITISYINLGAQIDTANVKRLIEAPRIIILGLLVGLTVMPIASWIAGHIFFKDQPMFRIGSFIYACGPAASASVLWTVMFDADKELALGLQIASTICALFTMPILIYAMDVSIGHYTVKTPYVSLARTLVILLVALLIGYRLVNYSKRAKDISGKIFKSLTMCILLFIVIFSSIVYYFIYRMFDWKIIFFALIVTCITYLLTCLFGYFITGSFKHMTAICISGTFRNSGLAFAALVVLVGNQSQGDVFIFYVPCLAQVVSTSLIGLTLYCFSKIT